MPEENMLNCEETFLRLRNFYMPRVDGARTRLLNSAFRFPSQSHALGLIERILRHSTFTHVAASIPEMDYAARQRQRQRNQGDYSPFETTLWKSASDFRGAYDVHALYV